ncbi:hypothetical protein ACWFQ8_29880 [Streptomyces sp. NPDC055254]
MTHRTQLSQPDEALQRARGDAPTEAARCLLRAVAQRLRDERPTDPMRNTAIDALALTYSERRFGVGTAMAEEAERQFHGHAPRITEPITRGEYSLILDRAAGGSLEPQACRVCERLQPRACALHA